MLRIELYLRKTPHRFYGGVFVPGNVLLQKIGVAQVMVVLVQEIGDTICVFQAGDRAGLDVITCPLQFFWNRAGRTKCGELLIDGLFDVLGLYAGPRRGGNLEYGSQTLGLLRGFHIKRDLLFVNEFLVQATGFASTEDRGGQVSVR